MAHVDEVERAEVAERIEVLPDRTLLYTQDGEAAAVTLHDRGLRPVATLVRRSSLEDVFLRLVGSDAAEATGTASPATPAGAGRP